MSDRNENNSPRGRPAARAVKGHNLYFAPSVSHLDFSGEALLAQQNITDEKLAWIDTTI